MYISAPTFWDRPRRPSAPGTSGRPCRRGGGVPVIIINMLFY